MRRVFLAALSVISLATATRMMTACSDGVQGDDTARKRAVVQSKFNDEADSLADIYLSCSELVVARESCGGRSRTASVGLRPATLSAQQLEDLLSKFEDILERAKKDICSILENFPSKEQVPAPPADPGGNVGTPKGRRPPGDYFIVGKTVSAPKTATVTFDLANKEAAVLVADGAAVPTAGNGGSYQGWALGVSRANILAAWATAFEGVPGTAVVLPASELYSATAGAFASSDNTLVGGVVSGALTTDVFDDLAAGAGPEQVFDALTKVLDRINEGAESSSIGRPIIRYEVKTSNGTKFIRFAGPIDQALAILAINPDELGSVAALQVLAESALAGAGTTVSKICKDSGGGGDEAQGGTSSGSSGGSSSGSSGSSGGSSSSGGQTATGDAGAGGGGAPEDRPPRQRPGQDGRDGGASRDERVERLIDLLERLLEDRDGGASVASDGGLDDGGTSEAGTEIDAGKSDCAGNADGWWCVDPQIYGMPYMVKCQDQGIALGFECASCTVGGTKATCPPPPDL